MGVIYVCGVVNVCCEYIKGKLMCYEVLRWARGYVLGRGWVGVGGPTVLVQVSLPPLARGTTWSSDSSLMCQRYIKRVCQWY